MANSIAGAILFDRLQADQGRLKKENNCGLIYIQVCSNFKELKVVNYGFGKNTHSG